MKIIIIRDYFDLQLHIPPHACSIHYELHKTDDGKHYLQLFYRKPGDEYPLPLNVPGCGKSFTIEKFSSVFKKLIPNDYESECRV